MSKITSKIKKFISRFVYIKIKDGYGVSIDSETKLNKLPKEDIDIKSTNGFLAIYSIKTAVNEFELYGTVRISNKDVNYRLKNIKTGVTIDVPERVFKILFSRK